MKVSKPITLLLLIVLTLQQSMAFTFFNFNSNENAELEKINELSIEPLEKTVYTSPCHYPLESNSNISDPAENSSCCDASCQCAMTGVQSVLNSALAHIIDKQLKDNNYEYLLISPEVIIAFHFRPPNLFAS